MKEIIVTVDKEGKAEVEAMGFKGSGCKDATKAIEKALGLLTKDTVKPEFYEKATVQDRLNQR